MKYGNFWVRKWERGALRMVRNQVRALQCQYECASASGAPNFVKVRERERRTQNLSACKTLARTLVTHLSRPEEVREKSG